MQYLLSRIGADEIYHDGIKTDYHLMCIGSAGEGVGVRVCVFSGGAFAAPVYRAAPASARPGLYRLICTAVLSFQVHMVRVLRQHNRPFLYDCARWLFTLFSGP